MGLEKSIKVNEKTTKPTAFESMSIWTELYWKDAKQNGEGTEIWQSTIPRRICRRKETRERQIWMGWGIFIKVSLKIMVFIGRGFIWGVTVENI
ncbi:unnamed protein product [Blepharisma stoltei]|uniref:Uncharacterized protein n=1 Tax=Blepharisma stoltei TaxID=1481888 RepID=A0AAU9JQY3_9CILI|nr:unnamed protein product [Blepharisma stoltei]